MSVRPSLTLISLTLFAILPATGAAEVYSWKGADGKIQYSDQPPPDKLPARKVAAPPAPSSDAADRRKATADKDMDARKKQKEANESAAKGDKEKAEAEDRKVNCEKAKGNLEALESGQVRFTIDAKGERVALDGAVREAELANARKAADSWCKKK